MLELEADLEVVGEARDGRQAVLMAAWTLPAKPCENAGSRSGGSGHVAGEDVDGVAVEVAPGAVVPGRGAGIGVPGGDLHVAKRDSGVEQRGNERVPEDMRVNVLTDARRGRAAPNDPRRRVPVHPRAGTGPQQRAG